MGIKIAHLYADELNLYGDSGNVLCLYRRISSRNIHCEITEYGIGDRLGNFDILFIGGGQDREMKAVSRDLKRKSEMLSYCIHSGKTVLAICGGYQLLGEYYQAQNGETLRLSGALPFYTVAGKKRMTGNIVFETPFGDAAGFENHGGRTYLKNGLKPLGKVLCGYGNNGGDNGEGLFFKNTFCTYAHGPLLPKNPAIADEIIKRALNTDELAPLDDTLENLCRESLIKRFVLK